MLQSTTGDKINDLSNNYCFLLIPIGTTAMVLVYNSHKT